jgi:hypothetical protein
LPLFRNISVFSQCGNADSSGRHVTVTEYLFYST